MPHQRVTLLSFRRCNFSEAGGTPMQVQDASTAVNDTDLAHEAGLVARAAGEPEAFGRLYDLYVERVYRYVYRKLGSHEDAEDVTAQTFRKALEAIGQYEWRGLPFGA